MSRCGVPAGVLRGAHVAHQLLEGVGRGARAAARCARVEHLGPEHQREETGLRDGELDVAAAGGGEPRQRSGARRQLRRGLVDGLRQHAEAARRDLGEQRREARVVAQRRAVRDARAARDAAQRQPLEAAAREQLLHHVEQALVEGARRRRRAGGSHVDSVYRTVDAVNRRFPARLRAEPPRARSPSASA